jgi:hypothetical protein
LPVTSGNLLKHVSGERFPDDDTWSKEQCARGSDSGQKNFMPQVYRGL